MSFYNQGGAGNGNSGGGDFYNSNYAGGGGFGQQHQPQQQQQAQAQTSGFMQPGTGFANTNPNANTASGFSGSSNYNNNMVYQQQQQQNNGYYQQAQMTTQHQTQQQFFNNAQAAATGLFAKGVTGNLNADDVMQETQKLFGGVFKSGIPGVDGAMNTLRSYFAVDNRYVKRKMQKFLFPFLSKQWKRFSVEGPAELENFALPHTDENAPDLYLPTMSLITYCLLCALLYGTAGEFNPEVIADVTTKCFITQLLEVAIIRFGFYMMQATIPILDLFAYTGYKYLGLTVNILFGMSLRYFDLGRSGYYVTFLWTASAASYFMLKTMANNIPVETASTGPKREFMVLAFAASQAASMWFVSQTKYL